MINSLATLSVWHNFLISLEIMWKGMLAIFIVLGVISIVVVILSKLQNPKKDIEQDNDEK